MLERNFFVIFNLKYQYLHIIPFLTISFLIFVPIFNSIPQASILTEFHLLHHWLLLFLFLSICHLCFFSYIVSSAVPPSRIISHKYTLTELFLSSSSSSNYQYCFHSLKNISTYQHRAIDYLLYFPTKDTASEVFYPSQVSAYTFNNQCY